MCCPFGLHLQARCQLGIQWIGCRVNFEQISPLHISIVDISLRRGTVYESSYHYVTQQIARNSPGNAKFGGRNTF